MKPKQLGLTACPEGAALLTALALLGLLACARPGLGQDLPMPEWLSKALTNRPQFAPATNPPAAKPATNQTPASAPQPTSPSVGGLSKDDLAMANAVIEENTLTLSLPGLGTTKDGPGPLTEADRLVLLALKLFHQRKALVPFSEFRQRLEPRETRERYRRVAEEFWAWYREAALKSQANQLGGYKSEFSTYIAMKNTAKRKAANRVLAGQVASDAAWRRAMESDRRTRDQAAQRAADTQQARTEWLRGWNVQAAEAAAAEKEWQLYLTHGASDAGVP